jgi:hypothetical protein
MPKMNLSNRQEEHEDDDHYALDTKQQNQGMNHETSSVASIESLTSFPSLSHTITTGVSTSYNSSNNSSMSFITNTVANANANANANTAVNANNAKKWMQQQKVERTKVYQPYISTDSAVSTVMKVASSSSSSAGISANNQPQASYSCHDESNHRFVNDYNIKEEESEEEEKVVIKRKKYLSNSVNTDDDGNDEEDNLMISPNITFSNSLLEQLESNLSYNGSSSASSVSTATTTNSVSIIQQQDGIIHRHDDDGNDDSSVSTCSHSTSHDQLQEHELNTENNIIINTNIVTTNLQQQQQQQQHDNEDDGKSMTSNYSSFTYGDASTTCRSVKYMFSGIVNSHCNNDNINDMSSHLSSHFDDNSDVNSIGDLSQHSYFQTMNDDENDHDDVISYNKRNGQLVENDLYYDTQNNNRIDDGNEKETMSTTIANKNKNNSLDSNLFLLQQRRQHCISNENHPQQHQNGNNSSSTILVTPEQLRKCYTDEYNKQYQKQAEAYQNNIHETILLNTVEKEKDEKQRKELLDVTAQNVVVAESNAQRMKEMIMSLRERQRFHSEKRKRYYNKLLAAFSSSTGKSTATMKPPSRFHTTFEDSSNHGSERSSSSEGDDVDVDVDLSTFAQLPIPSFDTPFADGDEDYDEDYNGNGIENEQYQNLTTKESTIHGNGHAAATQYGQNNFDSQQRLLFEDEEEYHNNIANIHTNIMLSSSTIKAKENHDYVYKQERIISNLVEPGCEKMKRFVSATTDEDDDTRTNKNENGIDGWCYDSPSIKTQQTSKIKSNDDDVGEDDGDDKPHRWYVQRSPNIKGLYYYQPSTGAMSRETPPSYCDTSAARRKVEQLSKAKECQYNDKHYCINLAAEEEEEHGDRINPRKSSTMNIDTGLNHDFIHLVSPIHQKKSMERRMLQHSRGNDRPNGRMYWIISHMVYLVQRLICVTSWIVMSFILISIYLKMKLNIDLVALALPEISSRLRLAISILSKGNDATLDTLSLGTLSYDTQGHDKVHDTCNE